MKADLARAQESIRYRGVPHDVVADAVADHEAGLHHDANLHRRVCPICLAWCRRLTREGTP